MSSPAGLADCVDSAAHSPGPGVGLQPVNLEAGNSPRVPKAASVRCHRGPISPPALALRMIQRLHRQVHSHSGWGNTSMGRRDPGPGSVPDQSRTPRGGSPGQFVPLCPVMMFSPYGISLGGYWPAGWHVTPHQHHRSLRQFFAQSTHQRSIPLRSSSLAKERLPGLFCEDPLR